MTLQLVRNQTLTYGVQGLQAASDEVYVNLSETFIELLGTLKGAPMSFMMAIGLHEAAIILRGAEPLTIPAISRLTKYSRRAVIYAADYLGARHFTDEGRNARGQRTFRPAAYMWFGGKRYARNSAEIAQSEPLDTASAISDDRAKRGVHTVQPPVDVVGTSSNSDNQIPLAEKQQTTAAQRIFQRVGIFGVSLDRLRAVSVEIAEQWAEWIENAPSSIRNPQGIAIAALTRDATAQPPAAKQKKERFADSVHDLHEVQQTCGTMAHKYWAPDHGGCEKCGIPDKRNNSEEP